MRAVRPVTKNADHRFFDRAQLLNRLVRLPQKGANHAWFAAELFERLTKLVRRLFDLGHGQLVRLGPVISRPKDHDVLGHNETASPKSFESTRYPRITSRCAGSP